MGMFTGRIQMVGADGGSKLLFRFRNSSGLPYVETETIQLDQIREAGKPATQDDRKPFEFYLLPVIDSSRYWVVWILTPNKKRRLPLGFGFRDRSCAFDFKASIQDYTRRFE